MRHKSHALIALASFAGLASTLALTAAARADDVKIGYINKMGEHPWFVAEVAGAKAEAAKLGVAFMSQDVHFDANLALTTFDTMVGDGVKAIAIVVPDKALGPVVAEKAEKAGIRLIAVDDDIYTSDKKMVPYVGMNAENIGRQAGAEDARIYKAEGWDKFTDVKLGSIEDQKADTCMRRNRGAEAAFLEAVPGFDKANIVRIPYDNHMESAVTAVTTTLTAHPEAKHWIFYSCNDDGVLGGVRATENQDFQPKRRDRRRHRRQPRLRRVRTGQAHGVPRHHVHRFGQGGRAGDRPPRRFAEGQYAPAGSDLCEGRPHHCRHLPRLQGHAVSQIGGTGRRGDAPLRNSGALDEANEPGAREAAAPALAAVGVSKRFGVVQALDDVTLSVRPREILALVGENGAGKSTLVRIFEGVYRPDQGALMARGAPRRSGRPPTRMRWESGSSIRSRTSFRTCPSPRIFFSATFAASTGCFSTAPISSGARARCWPNSGSRRISGPGSGRATWAPPSASSWRSCGRCAGACACSRWTSRPLP